MSKTFYDVIGAFVSVCDLTCDSVDMIQAGGGNASAKYDADGNSMMLIKASGFLMSEVDESKGYTQIELDKILKILTDVKEGYLKIEDEATLNARTAEANVGALRPSIETFLHALLPQRYILHVHALTTLVYASSTRFVDDLKTQWESVVDSKLIELNKALLVPYEKPGIHLAMAMMRGIEQYKVKHDAIPEVIVLQNHGLIVASEDSEALSDRIMAIENEIITRMGLPKTFDKVYADQRLLKKAINDVVNRRLNHKRIFVRANEDRDLVDYRDGMPSFPDALVFCGLEPLIIETSNNATTQSIAMSTSDLVTEGVAQYVSKYDDFPKVVLLDSVLYFCGESLKKCLEVQDVLKIQGILRRELGDSLVTLTQEQAYTLLNWEAEKYRKNL